MDPRRLGSKARRAVSVRLIAQLARHRQALDRVTATSEGVPYLANRAANPWCGEQGLARAGNARQPRWSAIEPRAALPASRGVAPGGVVTEGGALALRNRGFDQIASLTGWASRIGGGSRGIAAIRRTRIRRSGAKFIRGRIASRNGSGPVRDATAKVPDGAGNVPAIEQGLAWLVAVGPAAARSGGQTNRAGGAVVHLPRAGRRSPYHACALRSRGRRRPIVLMTELRTRSRATSRRPRRRFERLAAKRRVGLSHGGPASRASSSAACPPSATASPSAAAWTATAHRDTSELRLGARGEHGQKRGQD